MGLHVNTYTVDNYNYLNDPHHLHILALISA